MDDRTNEEIARECLLNSIEAWNNAIASNTPTPATYLDVTALAFKVILPHIKKVADQKDLIIERLKKEPWATLGALDEQVKELQSKLKEVEEAHNPLDEVYHRKMEAERLELIEKLQSSELKLARMEGTLKRSAEAIDALLTLAHMWEKKPLLREMAVLEDVREVIKDAPTGHILVSKAEVEKIREALKYYANKLWRECEGGLAKEALQLPMFKGVGK